MTAIKEKPKRTVKPIHKRETRLSGEITEQSDLVQLCKARLHQDFAECWRKGIAFHYTNEMTRALGTNFFISANPDGSEDLLRMTYDAKDVSYHLEKHLCGKGQGKYYHILRDLI